MADYIEQAATKATFNALIDHRPAFQAVGGQTLAEAFVEARKGLTRKERIDYLWRFITYGSRKNSTD